MVKKKEWPPIIKGVKNIENGQKVKVKNTNKHGEIVDFDNTTATIKFKNGKTEKFGLNKLTFLFEQMPNAIGAEIGSEPTVHNKKFRYNFDSPYEILPLDVARKIGEFIHIDFDHVKVEDLFAGMKTEAKKLSETPKTIEDWIKVAKIAKSNLDKDTAYYSDWVSESIRKIIKEEIKVIQEAKLRNVIREIIKEIIQEAKASHNVKVYLKPGEQAPKGAKVNKGERGGQYYYTKGAAFGGKHIGYPKKSTWFDREPQKTTNPSPKGFNKWAKDQGLDPDHKDTIDAFKETEDGKNAFKTDTKKLKTDSEGTHSIEHKGSKYYSIPGESKEAFIKRAKQNIKSDHKDDIDVKNTESTKSKVNKLTQSKTFNDFLKNIDKMPESEIKNIMGNDNYIDTPGDYHSSPEMRGNRSIEQYYQDNMGGSDLEKLKRWYEDNKK